MTTFEQKDKSSVYQIKIRIGEYKYPIEVEEKGNKLWLTFAFNRKILDEIKMMEGARWHGFDDPPIKKWSISNSFRNWFQLRFLQGENVYALYDKPLEPFTPSRKKKDFPQFASRWPKNYDPESFACYDHQVDLCSHWFTRHYAIWAAEMGTGKTLAALEVAEAIDARSWWWVGPKSALASVQLEFKDWRAKLTPVFMTYEQLVKTMNNWQSGTPAPKVVTFDESSKIKNASAQRSQAAMHLANSVRNDHGNEGYVLLMTGSPAPKNPADWWHQSEVACPGFLKEGSAEKCRNRLAIIKTETSDAGGKFPRVVAWKDDPKKCDVCGQPADDEIHLVEAQLVEDGHAFVPAINEVSLLYKRLRGLVNIKFKKDCLDLPPKIYKIIKCKPNKDILNAARLITLTAKSSLETLILLRELSDGFQYRTVKDKIECSVCKGASKGQTEGSPCPGCHNEGIQIKERRTIAEVPCPKDDEVLNLLDQHDEDRRIIFYAGFTESIDRVYRLCNRAGWKIIRVDGRGWYAPELGTKSQDLLEIFRSDSDDRIAFDGHPGSAGMGLNLTASKSTVYYSNDFNAENRIQSEDRTSRPGSRGSNIFDLVHLSTDLKILENLKRKRDLQAMTLGEMQSMMQIALDEAEREY
jgi:hypothetical protein